MKVVDRINELMERKAKVMDRTTKLMVRISSKSNDFFEKLGIDDILVETTFFWRNNYAILPR